MSNMIQFLKKETNIWKKNRLWNHLGKWQITFVQRRKENGERCVDSVYLSLTVEPTHQVPLSGRQTRLFSPCKYSTLKLRTRSCSNQLKIQIISPHIETYSSLLQSGVPCPWFAICSGAFPSLILYVISKFCSIGCYQAICLWQGASFSSIWREPSEEQAHWLSERTHLHYCSRKHFDRQSNRNAIFNAFLVRRCKGYQ